MPNFTGNEDLCKLGKEYLNDLICKFGAFCLQHSKNFDILHAFLGVTITELSMLKQVRFFLAHPVGYRWTIQHHIQHMIVQHMLLCNSSSSIS